MADDDPVDVLLDNGLDDDGAEAVPEEEDAIVHTTSNPTKLARLAINAFTLSSKQKHIHLYGGQLNGVPPKLVGAIYKKMVTRDDLRDFVLAQICDVNEFVRMFKHGCPRVPLISLVSTLIVSGRMFNDRIAATFSQRSDEWLLATPEEQRVLYDRKSQARAIDDGICIGSFLIEAGWLVQAETVLSTTLRLAVDQRQRETSEEEEEAQENRNWEMMFTHLECLTRLLHVQARYLHFVPADTTFKAGEELIAQIGVANIPKCLLAMWYTKVSLLFFAKSEYDLSNEWGILAVRQLDSKTPDKITVDVLRQAAKACVLKRHYSRAHMLIVQAVRIAKSVYGRHHHKYSDVLLDYAFFNLSVDAITKSVRNYEQSLKIRKFIYGSQNLYVAIAEEDLSYALYVYNYSSGRFKEALEHVERASRILRGLVADNHLFLASANRVKALILEEIALDTAQMDEDTPHICSELLTEAERLHLSALRLSLEEFGEKNVQTAKHYGNLGRLYQSMNKFEDAEKMHCRAIQIKIAILGPHDYEVGLSIGHLASLYNYHMYKYHDAEELYLTSISISVALFGDTYSGLEYDYRGLCHVYEKMAEYDKFVEFSAKLEHWKQRRLDEANDSKYDLEDKSLEEVTNKFFELCSVKPAPTKDIETIVRTSALRSVLTLE